MEFYLMGFELIYFIPIGFALIRLTPVGFALIGSLCMKTFAFMSVKKE